MKVIHSPQKQIKFWVYWKCGVKNDSKFQSSHVFPIFFSHLTQQLRRGCTWGKQVIKVSVRITRISWSDKQKTKRQKESGKKTIKKKNLKEPRYYPSWNNFFFIHLLIIILKINKIPFLSLLKVKNPLCLPWSNF